MLIFICDFCDTKYPAKPSLHGIKYRAEETDYTVERETDPCYKCEAEAEQAKKDALERKKVTRST